MKRIFERTDETEKTIYETYIYEDGSKYRVVVYANNGSTIIMDKLCDCITDCDVAEIIAKTDFENGYIRCADCGKLVMYDSIKNNRYFAGLYCNECWEREWKKIEAQEDYN